MIHIDRGRIPPPNSLTDSDSPGVRETRRAIAFYNDPANRDKSFPFNAYSGQDVKKCLEELFYSKCAYCESPYGATQPVDVEHFRPKGAVLVNGDLCGPGYYWLAANWDNLLPSCIDCNRPRVQGVCGQNAQVMGKASEFPIAREELRAKAPGEEENEERLLLNPCQDIPDEHLAFEVVGIDEVVVQPAQRQDGTPSPQGQESIRVYALQRPKLIMARGARIKIIKAQVARLNDYITDLNQGPDDKKAAERLAREMKELKRLLADDQPYAGMARQYVRKYMGK